MIIPTFDLPTTGTFSFTEHYTSPTGVYVSALAAATQARANVRALLKESRRTDDGDIDFLRLVKTLDDYLPHLGGIIACVDAGLLTEKQRPVFSWRTTLSVHRLPSAPRRTFPGLIAEHVFILLTYGIALLSLARVTVVALGDYERDRGVSDTERRAKDERLGFAVSLLCRASGVFTYVSDVVLSPSSSSGTVPSIEGSRPPELSREVSAALSKLSLASAQALAIRKLTSRAAADLVLSPGPPLPRSHPSPALVAKLHLDAADLCAGAHALLRMPGASRAKIRSSTFSSSIAKIRNKDKGKAKEGDQGVGEGEGDDDGTGNAVHADVLHTALDAGTLHAALARKWLGVDAGEADIHTRGGQAVGFLMWAKRTLEDAKDRGDDGARKVIQDEIEAVGGFLRHYKKLNDTLAYQPVPSQSELQALIPAGRLAVTPRPYAPPVPAFGPGSVDDTRAQTEALDVSSTATDDAPPPPPEASYLGRGSYF